MYFVARGAQLIVRKTSRGDRSLWRRLPLELFLTISLGRRRRIFELKLAGGQDRASTATLGAKFESRRWVGKNNSRKFLCKDSAVVGKMLIKDFCKAIYFINSRVKRRSRLLERKLDLNSAGSFCRRKVHLLGRPV